MSIYDCDNVKKTFNITKHQNRKLTLYCKYKKISASMLFRLFVDELRLVQTDESIRRKVQENAFKIDNLLGGTYFDEVEPPIKEYLNDDNGNKKGVWYKKVFHK